MTKPFEPDEIITAVGHPTRAARHSLDEHDMVLSDLRHESDERCAKEVARSAESKWKGSAGPSRRSEFCDGAGVTVLRSARAA